MAWISQDGDPCADPQEPASAAAMLQAHEWRDGVLIAKAVEQPTVDLFLL
ncbi:MAG: hypothetical protein R2856_16880 [Caldilineaceae bacterium]